MTCLAMYVKAEAVTALGAEYILGLPGALMDSLRVPMVRHFRHTFAYPGYIQI